jgi:hypothetical protein
MAAMFSESWESLDVLFATLQDQARIDGFAIWKRDRQKAIGGVVRGAEYWCTRRGKGRPSTAKKYSTTSKKTKCEWQIKVHLDCDTQTYNIEAISTLHDHALEATGYDIGTHRLPLLRVPKINQAIMALAADPNQSNASIASHLRRVYNIPINKRDIESEVKMIHQKDLGPFSPFQRFI